jgi:hypothetical protein
MPMHDSTLVLACSNDSLCSGQASDLPPLQLTAADTKAGGKAIKKSKLYTPNVANALQLSSDAASTKNTVRQLKRITLKVEDMNGALALVRYGCVMVWSFLVSSDAAKHMVAVDAFTEHLDSDQVVRHCRCGSNVGQSISVSL